jgi:hypothetical protein
MAVLDLLGSKCFAPVKSDLLGNIKVLSSYMFTIAKLTAV